MFSYEDIYNHYNTFYPCYLQNDLRPILSYWYAKYALKCCDKSKFRSRIPCNSSTSLAETQILSVLICLVTHNFQMRLPSWHHLKLFRTPQIRPLLSLLTPTLMRTPNSATGYSLEVWQPCWTGSWLNSKRVSLRKFDMICDPLLS